MSEFNKDGNLIGRLGALAVLAGMALLLGKIVCGPSYCPAPGAMCPMSDAAPAPAPAPAAAPATSHPAK